MSLVLFSGSLRTGSFNKKFLSYVARILTDLKVKNSTIDIRNLQLPLFDEDIEAKGLPDGVKTLGAEITAAKGLIISTPEYNGSISSPLKNTIDWLSRLKPLPLAKKPILLLGATPGSLGAVRGLLHTRVPLDVLGAYVFPQNLGIPLADHAFSETGDLVDPKMQTRVANLLNDYIKFTEVL